MMSNLDEQMIDVTIEALTGAVYDLCVSPFETILGIKMKIQRLEGIPVYQQHLVHSSTELQDEFCLEEYGIGSGAQLKLLVAMRGGPIHAHRVQLEDPALLEIAELLESRECDNNKYTVMLLRDGDTLELADVVQMVSEDSPDHVSPLPQSESPDLEPARVTLNKAAQLEHAAMRDKMRNLMERLRELRSYRKSQAIGSKHSGSKLHRRGTAKVLILDSRSSSRLLHSSAPSPLTPHLSTGCTPTKVQRKLLFPADQLTDTPHLPQERHSNPLRQLEAEAGSQQCKVFPPPRTHRDKQHRQWRRRRRARCRQHNCFQDKTAMPTNYNTTPTTTHYDNNLLLPTCSNNKAPPTKLETPPTDQCKMVDLSQGLSQLALGGKTEKRRRLNLPRITSAQRQLSSHPPPQHSSTVTHLPPLSVGHIPIQTGSGCGLGHGKRRSHCMRCGKKTGLASTYTCRCGGVYCALHRYAESHDCSYDYKSEGREMIARGNPLVMAPKLPKI